MYLLISCTFWEIGNTFRFLKTGHELPRWGKHSIWDSERRLSTRCSCNGDNPRIMHSTHVFIAQSRLSLTTRYFRDLLRSRPYTYGSARVKGKKIDIPLHPGLQMRVQEIPGVRTLRDTSSRSILHFLQLTFLTPTNAVLRGEYICLTSTSTRFSSGAKRGTGKAIDHSRRRRTRDRGKGSRQVDSI